jgi:hypothetical protein
MQNKSSFIFISEVQPTFGEAKGTKKKLEAQSFQLFLI